MILQSSEDGGTVGGDTPARVLGKEHRDTIVASSPPAVDATGSRRPVAGTAVRRSVSSPATW